MSLVETHLLSKVIDEKNFYVLTKHNIGQSDFTNQGDVYRFIRKYVKEQGTTPDFRTVVANFPDFDYQPGINDTFAYLCTQIKSTTAKRRAFEVLSKQASENFKKMSGQQFAAWLKSEADQIHSLVNTAMAAGTNWSTNGAERWQWYEDGKENRTGLYIPTPYESLTRWLGGGFELGDYILLMAFTNRGKSWLASDMGLAAWRNKFGVIHYSPELSKKQQIFRLDTLNGHFNNVELRRGALGGDELKYREYLYQFNETNETPYLVKTMEDLPDGLTVEAIEADLQMNENIQMVIIDGFNLLSHGSDRTSMTHTSRKLRRIFGKYEVAGLVVHQTPGAAEKANREEDEAGNRVVKPPSLDDYSETIAVIQDAATVLTFDQHDGVGKILIGKAREPHVGKIVELNCNFNLGFIREVTPCDHF
jgi:replicative DNA helicase